MIRNVLRFGQLLPLTLLVACGAEPPQPTPRRITEAQEGLWLDVQPATAEVTVRSGKAGDAVLALRSGQAVGLGVRTSQPKVQFSYGSFLFDDSAEPPWEAVVRLREQQVTATAAQYEGLGADGQVLADLTLTVDRPVSGVPSVQLRLKPRGATNRATVAYATPDGEHFLGLGGQSFDVDHRGHRVALWVEEDGIGKFPDAEPPPLWFLNGKRHQTHTPMPLYLSSRNQAVLLQSQHRVLVDLAKTEAGTVRWEDQGGAIDLRIWQGDGVQAVQRALSRHLGSPEPLPAFALLPWVDAIYGDQNVRRIAQKLREQQVPVSVIWSEDWRGGTMAEGDYTLDEDWQADAKLYPQIDKLAQDLHALGYKFLTYNNTFITQDADVWAEAKAKGYGIRRTDGSTYTFNSAKFVPATMLDLWNPAARKWAQEVYATGLQAGVDGWMADFCEWLPTDAVMADGTTGWDRHQAYPVECQRLNKELLDAWRAKDGIERLTFVRSAWLGSQPLVSVVWAGDQQTDFSTGDGLPSVIAMGIGLGVSGFPYYGHDIAGYASTQTQPTTKELFFRWTTLGALSPIMRTHHGKYAGLNWQWEGDSETSAHFGRWSRRHAQLFPYLWMLAADPELPMMRALALQYPQHAAGWTATDQYLLGDRIVVAPIVAAAATQRAVQLPPGVWYPLYGGAAVQGGAALPVDVSLTEIAAFVPAGALVPLLPEGSEVQWAQTLAQQSADEAWAKAAAGIALAVWPGGTAVAGGADDRADGPHRVRYRLGHRPQAEVADYRWYGQGWSGACQQATWNGQPVTPHNGVLQVQGAGVLVLDGQGRLEVGVKNANGWQGNADTQQRVVVLCRGK